jgi:hypothetical protein
MPRHPERSTIRSEAKDRAQSRDLLVIVTPPYCPAPTPATFSTTTFRKNSAASSGRTVLMNIPDPNSNPATRVNRGITLTYQ